MADRSNDIDDVMADVRAAASGDLSDDVATPDAGSGEAQTEAAPAEVSTAAPRDRDPATGRFVPKAGETQEQADAAGAAQAAAQPTTQPAEPELPHHWSAGDKELFGKVPAELRPELIDRFKKMEQGFQPKLQELGNYKREFDPVVGLFQPHMQTLRQKGLTMAGVVKAWADTEAGLMNPATAPQTIQRLAQAYGVQLQQNDGTPPAVDPAYLDPEVVALKNEVAALKQQLQPVGSTLEQLQRMERERAVSEEQRQLSAINAQINAFVTAKDEKGTPKHPYWQDVQGEIALVINHARENGQPMTLEQAYHRAVLLNPEVSQKLQTAQQAAAETARRAQAQAKAEQAKRAATGINASHSASAPAAGSIGSVLDDLKAAWAARGMQ